MSKVRISAVVGTGLILLFFVVGCSDTLSRSFYTHHPRSVQEVEKVWGEPVDIAVLDGGIEKRIYKLQMPTDAAFAFRFFNIESGMVVSSGISDTMDVAAK